MAHTNVGFLEAWKIVEKWSQPWQSNPAFSLGADSTRDSEPNMRNFPLLKMPRRRRRKWYNIETSESNKSPNQPSAWNPGRLQWKMNMDNSRTQISEPSSNNTEKRNNSKDQTALEKSLEGLESIQMEDEVKNVLVMIINLVINSGDTKAMVRHMWKAVELHEQHYNKIQRESTN
jgi:hypothetical protein